MTGLRKGQSQERPLIARLRDLEGEFLRISATDISSERQEARAKYEERLQTLDHSHSRSWFGDHSSTYFEHFQSPPPGRTFDVEWGFIPGYHGQRNAGWRIYSRDQVRQFAFQGIGEEIFNEVVQLEQENRSKYAVAHDQALDILEVLTTTLNLPDLGRYKERIENSLKPYDLSDYIVGRARLIPTMTRDSEEIAKGSPVPVHVQYLSSIEALERTKERARELASVLRNIIEFVSLYIPAESSSIMSNRVFLGHGRSEQWRILKDFLSDRLHISYEEFNRISPAGLGTQERLAEMLDQCGFAFLVLTAEDVRDGALHARENVVHEVGLFQGRLGWRKAIVLLEEGCEEFSNIVGLGQIRFPKANISACFEEVRRVLEREGLLNT
jgi:hypothetical protein